MNLPGNFRNTIDRFFKYLDGLRIDDVSHFDIIDFLNANPLLAAILSDLDSTFSSLSSDEIFSKFSDKEYLQSLSFYEMEEFERIVLYSFNKLSNLTGLKEKILIQSRDIIKDISVTTKSHRPFRNKKEISEEFKIDPKTVWSQLKNPRSLLWKYLVDKNSDSHFQVALRVCYSES